VNLAFADPRWLIGVPVAWLVIALLEWRRRGTTTRRVMRTLTRGALASCVLLALAGPHTPGSEDRPRRLVILIDRSEALDDDGRREAFELARAATAQAHRQGIDVTLLPVAGRAGEAFDLPALAAVAWPTLEDGSAWLRSSHPRPGGAPLPRAPRADLARGLATAAAAFASGETGKVLILANGIGGPGDPSPGEARLRARGVRVEAVAVPSTRKRAAPAPRVVDVRTPDRTRGDVRVRVAAATAGRTDLRVALLWNGQAHTRTPLTVASEAEVVLTAPPPGLHEVAVALEDASGSLVTPLKRRLVEVVPPPRIMGCFVDPMGSPLRAALAEQGLQVGAVPPSALGGELSLPAGRPDVLVLDADAAASIPEEAQTTLVREIEDGLGLFIAGGTDKAAWERLREMPLGAVLPWRPVVVPEPPPPTDETPPEPQSPEPDLDPPEDDEGPGIAAQQQPGEALPITLLLVIDRSQSMYGRKLALAIEGARRAARRLSPWDRIGVITFSNTPSLDFAPRSARGADKIPTWLASVSAGGGTNIWRALQLASSVLAKETTPIQHVVLISDGHAPDGGIWSRIVGPMGQRGVTLTAIGIGEDADRAELRRIASYAARGSVIPVFDPEDLPSLMTKDTRGLAERREIAAERLDRLRNPNDSNRRKPEPESERESTPTPPPRDEPQPAEPPPTPPEAAPTRAPLRMVRGHEATRDLDTERLPRVTPPRPGEVHIDAVPVLVREEGGERAPAFLVRRHGLGRILQWTLRDDDPGVFAWLEHGRLIAQATRAGAAPLGARGGLPMLRLEGTAARPRLRVEWPAGDTPAPVKAVLHGAGEAPIDLGVLDPVKTVVERTLDAVPAGAVLRVEAELAGGRALPTASWVAPPAPRPQRRAGDRAGLERRFGPAPARPALAASIPVQTAPTRGPRWPWFTWLAVALLVADVAAHRPGRLA